MLDPRLCVPCVVDQISSRSQGPPCDLCVGPGCIFHNRGPLPEVCCGADTHVRSQTARRCHGDSVTVTESTVTVTVTMARIMIQELHAFASNDLPMVTDSSETL